MLYNERIKWMLKQINEKGSIRLTEIAKILDISESTVRRDINALHNQGLLRRVHGGAISMENKTHLQKDIDPSLPGNTQKQKQSIGEFAATLINHHDTVFIDSGTTTGFMLDHIAARDILAVTDSIGHAKTLVSRGVRTIILSGEIHPDSGTAIGPLGVEQLYQMNFDKAFLCTDGYSAKAGFTTEDSYEAKIKRTAVLRATKAFVLADSTKADRIAMTSFASGDEIILITDEISEKNKGLQYLLAKDSKQKI